MDTYIGNYCEGPTNVNKYNRLAIMIRRRKAAAYTE